MAVFIQNAFQGWGSLGGLGLVVSTFPGAATTAPTTTTGGDPRTTATGRAGATMTQASSSTPSSTMLTPNTGGPTTFRTPQEAQAYADRQAAQRKMNVDAWAAELGRTVQDSVGLLQQVEIQWRDVQALNRFENFRDFVQWVGTTRSRMDANAQKAMTLRDSIVNMAGADTALSAAVSTANAQATRATSAASRVAELERFGQLAAQQAGVVGQSTGAQTGGFNIPTWGYVAAGIAVLGAAWYFGRK